MLLWPTPVLYLLLWDKPPRALLTTEFGSFLHGLVLEPVEDWTEMAWLILLHGLSGLWLDLVSGNDGGCVSYVWWRSFEFGDPLGRGQRVRIGLQRIGRGLELEEGWLLLRIGDLRRVMGQHVAFSGLLHHLSMLRDDRFWLVRYDRPEKLPLDRLRTQRTLSMPCSFPRCA